MRRRRRRRCRAVVPKPISLQHCFRGRHLGPAAFRQCECGTCHTWRSSGTHRFCDASRTRHSPIDNASRRNAVCLRLRSLGECRRAYGSCVCMNGWPSATAALSQPSPVDQTAGLCTKERIVSTGLVGPEIEDSRLRLADAIWLFVIS